MTEKQNLSCAKLSLIIKHEACSVRDNYFLNKDKINLVLKKIIHSFINVTASKNYAAKQILIKILDFRKERTLKIIYRVKLKLFGSGLSAFFRNDLPRIVKMVSLLKWDFHVSGLHVSAALLAVIW